MVLTCRLIVGYTVGVVGVNNVACVVLLFRLSCVVSFPSERDVKRPIAYWRGFKILRQASVSSDGAGRATVS